jgi:hypothetical protein
MGGFWDGYYETARFSSGRDTGKWMFRIPVAEAGAAMELLYEAVSSGAVPAAKRSSPALERITGGVAILIAYAADKSPAGAAAALAVLRSHGLWGRAEFKDDMATYNGNDDIAYRDVDFEEGVPFDGEGFLPAGAVLRLDDATYVESRSTGHAPCGGPRGVGFRLQAASRGGLLDEDLWTDPEIRVPRRMNLLRIEFDRVVHVIGADWGPSSPRRR